MPRVALTDRFVAGAKPDASGRTDYFDATAKGLALRVTGSHRSWTFNFTSPKDGKRARMTLGAYPAMALAKARAEAIEARGHLDDGRDPRDAMAARDASAMTVADLLESYLQKHARPALRSAAAIERRMEADVIPIIGSTKLADLHRRDINRVLDPIVARDAPIQARVVFQNLRAMLRWAVSRGDLDHSPMEGLRPPSADEPRERALSDDEIRILWDGLPKALARSKACQRIIRLCLVTGQRVGEVSGTRKDELDIERKTWSLPGARTKNGHPHEVPVSDMAAEIIGEAIADSGESPFVFPTEDGGALSPSAVSRTVGRANATSKARPAGRFGIGQWTAHDLRRTALTGMARLGISPIVLGHVANHRTVTKGGITMAVYIKHEFSEEKRRALEAWATYLEALLAGPGANVVPIRRLDVARVITTGTRSTQRTRHSFSTVEPQDLEPLHRALQAFSETGDPLLARLNRIETLCKAILDAAGLPFDRASVLAGKLTGVEEDTQEGYAIRALNCLMNLRRFLNLKDEGARIAANFAFDLGFLMSEAGMKPLADEAFASSAGRALARKKTDEKRKARNADINAIFDSLISEGLARQRVIGKLEELFKLTPRQLQKIIPPARKK